MYKEVIDNLPNNLLLELYNDISGLLTELRQTWLNDEKSRTLHFRYLITQTRTELNYMVKQIKLKGLK